MNSKYITYATCLVAIAGILLHIYLTIYHTMSGSIYFVIVPAMNVIPYLVCIYLARSMKKPVMPLLAAILVLAMDLYLFQEYFFSTTTYRYLFIETMQILMKTIVIVPAGCFAGFLIDKVIKRDGEKKGD
jgi:hypothetical protein